MKRAPEVLTFTPPASLICTLAGRFRKPDGTRHQAPRPFRRAARYARLPGRRGRKARARLLRIERRYASAGG
jgi:hypothetical protein